MDSKTPIPKATVYHDGECSLCQIEVNAMKKIDVDSLIKWVDITKDKQALEAIGLSFEDAMANIHVADESQKLHVGVRGFMNTWQHLRYYRKLEVVVRRTPLLLPILEFAYRLFAKYRLRISARRPR